MPEIFIEELLNQKEIAFNLSYQTLLNNYTENSYGLIGNVPKNNIKLILEKERKEYAKKYSVIKLKYTSDLMKKLVDEALTKKAPFDKSIEGKKTDAGFKDALIWKTVVYSKEIDTCNEICFFTADKAFEQGKNELEEEFKANHPNTNINIIYINNDDERRQNVLNYLIEKYRLYKTDVIKLYNNQFIKSFLKFIEYTPTNVKSLKGDNFCLELKKINFEDFDSKDFYIENVEKKMDYLMYIVFLKLLNMTMN